MSGTEKLQYDHKLFFRATFLLVQRAFILIPKLSRGSTCCTIHLVRIIFRLTLPFSGVLFGTRGWYMKPHTIRDYHCACCSTVKTPCWATIINHLEYTIGWSIRGRRESLPICHCDIAPRVSKFCIVVFVPISPHKVPHSLPIFRVVATNVLE